MATLARMNVSLPVAHGKDKNVMINATYLKAPRATTSMDVKRARGRPIGRINGGIDTKLYAICDSQNRSLSLIVTSGRVSDGIDARACSAACGGTIPDPTMEEEVLQHHTLCSALN